MTRTDPLKPRGLNLSRASQPRWIASPELRALGWQSTALKHANGTYMTTGEAVDAAHAINRLIDDYATGLPVSGPWARLAPARKASKPAGPDERTIGGLIDAYLASPDFLGLAATTQADAKGRLNRLLETLCGHKEGKPSKKYLPATLYERELLRYDADMAYVRATPFMDLIPDDHSPDTPLLQQAYENLAGMINEDTGKAMIPNAAAIMRYASMWLSWVKKTKRANWKNPVEDIAIKIPEGRIEIWDPAEIKAVCERARQMGWHSVAFAVELALELSWSQADVLALKWGDIKNGRILSARAKTGIKTETTLTRNGLDLFDRIRAYYQAEMGDNVTPAPTEHVLTVDRIAGRANGGSVGLPWNRHYFRHIFIDVRRESHVDGDEIHNTFQDFRDTSITIMYEASLTFPEIASRTRHSLTHIQKVVEKHYGKITRKISDSAADKLNAYHAITKAQGSNQSL